MNLNKKAAFVLGVILGALAFWIYANRAALGFAATHQTQISGANQIVSGFQKVFG